MLWEKINTPENSLGQTVPGILNSLSSYGCNLFIDKATRITSKSATCIDHVYSNKDSDLLDNYIIESDVSDHFSTLTRVSGLNLGQNDSDEVYVRKSKLSCFEWHQFNQELYTILTDQTSRFDSENTDVDRFAGVLTDTYKYLINKYMPLNKLSRSERRYYKKPWLTDALKKCINKKNLMYRLSKRKNDSKITLEYNQYRNILTNLKRKAKDNYYKQKLSEYGHNKSKTWQIINEITLRKKKNGQHIPRQMVNEEKGVKISQNEAIAQLLNGHFGTIGKNMASKFKNLSASVVDTLRDPLDYIQVAHTSSAENLFKFRPTNVSEIKKIISKLEIKKACGYDSITNNVLKNTCHVTSLFFVNFFNACVKQGSFPNIYKIAKVIPLFKGGYKESVNCYRPISLLPAFGKLIEKLVSFQILDYFEKFDLLSEHQFGFRKHYGTEFAILDISEKILKNLDDGLNTCSIFLDLAKAFDSVSHEILLRKLWKYGIRGTALSFFKSYLSGRSQFTKIGCVNSRLINILFGVPQGSILGPLLFLVFINDLPSATNFFIKLFADDTFLCAQDKDLIRLENTVNVELKKVFSWLASNKLTLNVSKSKYMLTLKNKSLQPCFDLKINNEPLEECSSYKYLGVYIDKNLTWKTHVENVCKKVAKA